jgi:hypothetical protein
MRERHPPIPAFRASRTTPLSGTQKVGTAVRRGTGRSPRGIAFPMRGRSLSRNALRWTWIAPFRRSRHRRRCASTEPPTAMRILRRSLAPRGSSADCGRSGTFVPYRPVLSRKGPWDYCAAPLALYARTGLAEADDRRLVDDTLRRRHAAVLRPVAHGGNKG